MFEIGNSLQEARERQGIELPEAEIATKVRGKYLRALEDERFDLLPGHTYVKGFLRSYAEYLGLDGQLYVDEYNSRYVGIEDETPFRTRRTAQNGGGSRPVDSRPLLLALGAIALVTGLVIAAFTLTGSNPGHRAAKARTPARGAERRHRARKAVPKRKQHPRATVARLSVTATHGPSWIRVHAGSRTGQQLYGGTLDTGRTQIFTRKRLWVEIGRPGNLVVRLNGRRQRLPGGAASETVVVTPTRIAAAPTAA